MSARCIVILLGPPGAGKGTQASRLGKDLSLPHVSTGDLFRDNLARKSDLGRQAKGFMEAGKLVPDTLVLDMLFERVGRPDCARGYLLDGFPRTLAQAEAFEKSLERDAKIVALNLKVADDVLVLRLSGRRTCEGCGSIFHLQSSPPRVAGVCDKCGKKLVQRPDDSAEVVKKRLAVYREQTQPLEAFYAARRVLVDVDGHRPADAVFADLKRASGGPVMEGCR